MSKAGKVGKPAPRAWQRMLSGRRLDLLDPSPLDVELEDIAHGLARDVFQELTGRQHRTHCNPWLGGTGGG